MQRCGGLWEWGRHATTEWAAVSFCVTTFPSKVQSSFRCLVLLCSVVWTGGVKSNVDFKWEQLQMLQVTNIFFFIFLNFALYFSVNFLAI